MGTTLTALSSDAGAVREIADLARAAAEPRAVHVELGDAVHTLIVHEGHVIDPRTLTAPEMPEPLKIETLAGVLEYLRACVDGGTSGERPLALVVDSPTQVRLVTHLSARRRRETLVIASAGACNVPFGTYLPQPQFVVMLQSQFVRTDALTALLAQVSSVVRGETVSDNDDGVGQTVIVERRAGLKSRLDVTPIHRLSPYRTFREVAQPESDFLLRAKVVEGETCLALIEADGGAWRLEARRLVAELLRQSVAQVTVLE